MCSIESAKLGASNCKYFSFLHIQRGWKLGLVQEVPPKIKLLKNEFHIFRIQLYVSVFVFFRKDIFTPGSQLGVLICVSAIMKLLGDPCKHFLSMLSCYYQ